MEKMEKVEPGMAAGKHKESDRLSFEEMAGATTRGSPAMARKSGHLADRAGGHTPRVVPPPVRPTTEDGIAARNAFLGVNDQVAAASVVFEQAAAAAAAAGLEGAATDAETSRDTDEETDDIFERSGATHTGLHG
jgi:hypothetical protein